MVSGGGGWALQYHCRITWGPIARVTQVPKHSMIFGSAKSTDDGRHTHTTAPTPADMHRTTTVP